MTPQSVLITPMANRFPFEMRAPPTVQSPFYFANPGAFTATRTVTSKGAAR